MVEILKWYKLNQLAQSPIALGISKWFVNKIFIIIYVPLSIFFAFDLQTLNFFLSIKNVHIAEIFVPYAYYYH
jgi:hypothetical protein